MEEMENNSTDSDWIISSRLVGFNTSECEKLSLNRMKTNRIATKYNDDNLNYCQTIKKMKMISRKTNQYNANSFKLSNQISRKKRRQQNSFYIAQESIFFKNISFLTIILFATCLTSCAQTLSQPPREATISPAAAAAEAVAETLLSSSSSSSDYHYHESSFSFGLPNNDHDAEREAAAAADAPTPAQVSGRSDSGDQLLVAASTLARSSTTTTRRQAPTALNLQQQSDIISDQDELILNPQFAYDYHSNMPVITKRELGNAIKQAITNVDKRLASLDESSSGAAAAAAAAATVATNTNEIFMETGSTGWLASSMFHKPAPENDELLWNQTRQSMISEETTRLLAKQFKLNKHQILRGLPLISVEATWLGKQCARQARQFNCIPGQYRSLSGHCNNVQNPDWASAQMPLVRYAPARYLDNISKPLRSATKQSAVAVNNNNNILPSARQVSMAIYEARARVQQQQPQTQQHSSHMTTMLSFFGQFIFHDLSFVPQFSKSIKCCNVAKQVHSECMPIEYGDQEQVAYCLNYIRSATAVRAGCNLGARDQINLVSSYLDGSVIYGSSETQARSLRSFVGGRLRAQRMPTGSSGNGHGANNINQNQLELLPQIKLINGNFNNESNSLLSEQQDAHWLAAAEECKQIARMRATQKMQQQRGANNNNNNNNRQQVSRNQQQQVVGNSCFQAGDIRVNENIGLTLMHTIWMREHNYIADQLAGHNPHWRDERLFEEARKIVIAELQHITYSEFLPSILGEEVMQRFNLTTLNQGYSDKYDPQSNAGISNELATAIFPFILSTIPNTLERYSDRLEMLGATQLVDTFMDASDLFKRNKFAQYLTGMMSQNAMEPALGLMPMSMDNINNNNNNNLLPNSNANNNNSNNSGPPEIDVIALTIQQGRDHGLRSYLYWRRACQLQPTVKSWSDLAQLMPSEVVDKLKDVYASVEQLDLYLALLESPAPGATVGPTFVCLLARQFYHLKFGDRFWFENDFPRLAFTPKQLDEIRQTTLAKVMCRNSQSSISFIQPLPMLTSDPYLNAYQYCTNKAMGDLDLSKWKQTVTSAQLIADEQLIANIMSNGGEGTTLRPPSLIRGKRLVESNSDVIVKSLEKARDQLEQVARNEASRIRQAMAVKVRAKRHAAAASGGGGAAAAANGRFSHSNALAGYRHLPRPKRQALKINNQSVILELATNEVIRSLLHQGKDREQAQSVQMDIRDFLFSLESIQLDNLLDNSAASDSLSQFISSANGFFLTEEQRNRLAALGDSSLTSLSDPLNDILPASTDQRSSSVSQNCQDDDRAFPCDHTTQFRTITGWCNNLQNPKFGQSFTIHDRILPSAYEDGLSKPRSLSTVLDLKRPGERLKLPSPRVISTTMHDDKSHLHSRYSLALMQFGQFGVDHDLTRTPFSVALDGSLLDCSACDSQRTIHRDCLPIEVPDNDAHFGLQQKSAGDGQKKCLHFVRSLNGQTGLGPRQQINALTAYFDASEIYGSDNCEAKSLRSFSGGRLNSSAYPSTVGLTYTPREILPVTRANPECVTPNGLCFHAGDQRASEQPGLTSVHTIFMRLHNSIVQQLAQINRHWNDERLYQHGRRIVSAIMQRITYNEFAPRLLGLDYMSKFDLILKQVGYSNDYDESCSASILTEFAAAAFRMGHSLIRSSFPLLNRQYKSLGKGLQLRTAFFNSHRILTEPQLIDSIMRGIVSTPIETLDNSITEELTNHLFERPREPFSGMDLISLNIQRARDHGISSYNKYRVKCNLTRAKTFDDLAGEIPQKLIKRFASIYHSVDDIDLFTGGISELPVHGGIIGPTFGCIIGMQFQRLKKCDRFWHETSDPFVRFSLTQLAEVRKMTLAKVICSQSDTIDMIQRNAMDVPDHYLNPRVPCSSLPSIDFSVWRENQKSCQVNKIKFELGQTKRVNPCKSCTCTTEGPVCRTAKINCLKMMRKLSGQSMNQLMADKSCLVQCAWALDMQQLATTG